MADQSQPAHPSSGDTEQDTLLSGINAAWLEALYADYQENPASVPTTWQNYFAELNDKSDSNNARHAVDGPDWQRADWPPRVNGEATALLDGDWSTLEASISDKLSSSKPATAIEGISIREATKDSLRALMLIRAFRIRGHLIADLDPLGLRSKDIHPELDPATYGFGADDYDRPIFIDNVLGLETATLREILDILTRTYCGTFAVEFMHITNPEQKAWIQQRIEGPDKDITFTKTGKRAILKKLIEAEGFENFLNKKYTGTKRFGLDGGESMVPALEQIIKRGGAMGDG